MILAAAGTSDPTAQRDLHTMATWLSAITGSRVELAFAATGSPRVSKAVSALHRGGRNRVVVASYLLFDDLFQDRLPGWRRRRGDRADGDASRNGAAHREPVPPRPDTRCGLGASAWQRLVAHLRAKTRDVLLHTRRVVARGRAPAPIAGEETTQETQPATST